MKKITSHSEDSILYSVHYRSNNNYFNKAQSGILDFLIIPESGEGQNVLGFDVHTSPYLRKTVGKNHLGFQTIRIFINQPLHHLRLDFNATVEKVQQGQLNLNLRNDIATELSHDFYVRNYFFLQQTDLTDMPEESRFHEKKKPEESPLAFLIRTCDELHKKISYRQNVTDVCTRARDVVLLRAGVCQDFSHVLLGLCRANGIAARYVSGYLHSGHDVAQLHAWVEAYIPGNGWVGVDAANNCFVNKNYIKIAHGADYTECAPIRGTIESSGEHTTQYSVQVSRIEQQKMQKQT